MSVCLLTDMAEPIQQITSNNQGRHQRERISYTLLARKEKVTTWDTALKAFRGLKREALCYRISSYVFSNKSANGNIT